MRNNLKDVRCNKVLTLGTIIAALVATLSGAQQAQATPAGLTFYPATDIYGKGNFHFDSDFFTRRGEDTTATSVGLSYGIGPERDGFFGRSEIGFDYVTSGQGIDFSKRLLLNGKTQLYNNDDAGTRLVAGFWGVGSEGDLNNGNTVFPPNVGYILGSKAFKFGRVHLGVARVFADEDVIVTPGGNDDRTAIQYGYDKVFGNGKFQFTFDGWTGKSAVAVQAPGIIYYVNDKAAFQLGYVHYNDSSLGNFRNQVYFGFDYNFGGSPTPPAEAQPAQPGSTGPSADGTPSSP